MRRVSGLTGRGGRRERDYSLRRGRFTFRLPGARPSDRADEPPPGRAGGWPGESAFRNYSTGPRRSRRRRLGSGGEWHHRGILDEGSFCPLHYHRF